MRRPDVITPALPAAPPSEEPYRPALLAWLFPPLTRREWQVFGIATTAGFFDNYDTALLNLALRQVQRGLGIAEARLGDMLSVVRLGNLLALLMAPLADVFGRRRLLLYTIVGYTVFTGLSAVAPNSLSFVACQFVARGFAGTEGIIALVLLVEEVRAEARGWMVGLLGALVAAGYGLAAIAFAQINWLPFGWRGLYALALIPLLFIIPLRRLLPESRRFERDQLARMVPEGVFRPLVELFRFSPKRLAMVASTGFLVSLGNNPGSYLYAKYLQEAHGWTPGEVSELVFLGGAIGIFGNIIAGRLSDRCGRRKMGSIFLMLGPLLTIWMFQARDNSIIVAWVLRLFFDTAAATIVSAYVAELFPTVYRAAAGSALTVANTGGGALGLYLEGLLYVATGSHWTAICYLTIFWMMSPFVMLFAFPETAGLELEAIAPIPDPNLLLRTPAKGP